MTGACYELQEHNFRETGRCCGNRKGAAGQGGLGQTPLQLPRWDRASEPLRALPSHWETCTWKLPGEKKTTTA